MNLAIKTDLESYDVQAYDKADIINVLKDLYFAGQLTTLTTDLPKNIVDIPYFEANLECIADLVEDQEEQLWNLLYNTIESDWDTLHDMCNEYSEGYAKACLEYANGGDLSGAQENYLGVYNSDEDFVREMNEDVLEEIPQRFHTYFDWESFTADCMHDYVEYNGHYFTA
jgi:hypothetical protein